MRHDSLFLFKYLHILYYTCMNYWGKVTNTFGNFTGANTEQLQAQLKSRQKLIKELGSDLTKLKEENQYMNKAFEQLEEINRSSEQKLQSITTVSKQCTQSIMQTIKANKQSLASDIYRQFSEQLEDLLGEPIEDQNLIINLQADCTKSLEKSFRGVFDKCIESIDKSKQIEEIKVSFKEKQQHLNAKIQQQRQQSVIVVNQLKSMHSTEKQNVAKLQGELKSLKISQQKSQKQVFIKCEENNALVQKNKTLNSQLSEKDQQIQKLTQRIKQLDTDKSSSDNSKLINALTLIKADIQEAKKESMSIKQHLSCFQIIPDEIITPFIQNISSIMPAKTSQFTVEMQEYLGREILEKMGQICDKMNGERIDELMGQIDKLNGYLQQIKHKYKNKLEKTKEQYEEISRLLVTHQQAQKLKENQLNQEMMNMMQKIESLSIAITNKQSSINDLQASLKEAEQSQKNKIDLQKQLDILKEENQRVRDTLIQAQQQSELIKAEHSTQMKNCRTELDDSKRQCAQLNAIIQQHEQKIERLQKQQEPSTSGQSQQEITKLKEQIIQLQKQNKSIKNSQIEIEIQKQSQRSQKNQEQRNTYIEQKQSEISKLTELSKKLMEDLAKTRHSHHDQLLNHQEVNNQLKQTIQEQKDQMAIQLKQYQQKIQDLTDEARQQQKKIEERLQQQNLARQQLEKNNAHLQLELQNLQTQSSDENNSEIASLQVTIGEQKNRVNELEEENKQLLASLKSKEDELQQQMSKTEELKDQTYNLKKDHSEELRSIQEQKDKIEQKLNTTMIEKQEIEQQSQKTTGQLGNIKTQLVAQIEKLRSELQMSSQKLQSEKQQLTEEKNKLHNQMDTTIKNQQNIIDELTKKNQSIKQELETTKANLQETQSRNKQLGEKVEELKNDIDMMDDVSKQMDEQYIKLEAASKTAAEFKTLKQLFMDKWGKELIESNVREIHVEFMDQTKQYEETISSLNKTKKSLEQSQKAKQELKQALQNIQCHLRQQLEAILKDNKQLKNQISEKENEIVKLEHSISTKQTTEESFSKQIEYLSGKMEQVQKQKKQAIESIETQKRQAIQSIKAQKKQAEDSMKKQLQNMKNKYEKMERTVSQAATNNSDLKQKVKAQQNKMIDQKKQQQELEAKLKQKSDKLQSNAEEIGNLQKQLEKMIIDSTERVKKERQNGKKELGDLEEMFKSEKSTLLKKHSAEVQKLKQQTNQKENQIKQLKAKLNEEKKAGAMLTAKLEEMKQQISKIQSIQNSNNSIKSKLLQKQEELRKAFQNMQNLKSTICELETGIETYHGFVEQKSEEISELQQEFDKLKLQYDTKCKDNQSLKQRVEQQGNLFQALNNESVVQVDPHAGISDKKQMILPIKRLFLKYFEEAATYQQKINTLNTLCEVLGLDKKQQEIIKSYKKYKLANIEIAPKQKEQKAPEGIQNKFFEFLTAD